VNEEVERAVWARAFKAALSRGARAADCGLLLTEPLLNLPAIQESTAQARGAGRHCGLTPPPPRPCVMPCTRARAAGV